MIKKIMLALAVALTLAGCSEKDEVPEVEEPKPCTYDSCKVKAPEAEIQLVRNYLETNAITATQHCSGLFYTIVSEGSGKVPQPCLNVTLRYKGSLTTGAIFDSTAAGRTVTFNLNPDRLIRGFVNGLPLIKNGGRIKLYIPASLGYGANPQTDSNNNVIIPANSTLIFDVELTGVQ